MKKMNWEVNLKLTSFENQTKIEVVTLIRNLLCNYFKEGRIEAK